LSNDILLSQIILCHAAHDDLEKTLIYVNKMFIPHYVIRLLFKQTVVITVFRFICLRVFVN